MKRLDELLRGIKVISIEGLDDRILEGISVDSRKVLANELFIAVKGTVVDGHSYIPSVIDKGCSCIVLEVIPEALMEGVTYVRVENSVLALGKIASNWHDNPSEKLKLVGITGTNGKTTCTSLLYNLCESMGFPSALISTVKIVIHKKVIPANQTTPSVIEINQILAEAVSLGCEYAFMEVSSHGIHQDRIAGLHFAVAGFTNITHDHLDYHGTFRNYILAKKKFFDGLPSTAVAITNIDDKNGLVMLQNTQAQKKTYSLRRLSDHHAKIIEMNLQAMLLQMDGYELWVMLTGKFNAYNLLLVYSTALSLGFDKEQVLTKITQLKNVEGRFQSYMSESGIFGLVDYAHTPDALESILTTIETLRTRNEKLILVFGCGGNRDKAKRPLMGMVASKYSEVLIVTNDNPRDELPENIINEILDGIPEYKRAGVTVLLDRKDAIERAVSLARKGDIIVIAGKGHEDYQEVAGIKYPFNDYENLLNALKNK